MSEMIEHRLDFKLSGWSRNALAQIIMDPEKARPVVLKDGTFVITAKDLKSYSLDPKDRRVLWSTKIKATVIGLTEVLITLEGTALPEVVSSFGRFAFILDRDNFVYAKASIPSGVVEIDPQFYVDYSGEL